MGGYNNNYGGCTQIFDNMEEQVESLINFSGLSNLLTGRPDIIRKGRIQKKHKKKYEELVVFMEYWIRKNVEQQ